MPTSQYFAVIPSKFVDVDVSAADQVCPGKMVAIYVGTTGNIAIEDFQGNSFTFSSLPVGFHALKAKKILNSGTTSANVIILIA